LVKPNPEDDVIAARDEVAASDDRAKGSGPKTLRDISERLAQPAREVRSKPAGGPPAEVKPVLPQQAAASLLFARLFDERPELLRSIYEVAPVVLIDIADRMMLAQVKDVWKVILYRGVRSIEAIVAKPSRRVLEVAHFIVEETPKASLKEKHRETSLDALCSAQPLIAISPSAQSHLPDILFRAATARIDFPRLDLRTIVQVIRVVTGRPCRELIDASSFERTTLEDLVIAVRCDRTPGQCVAELQRLNALKESMRAARDLTLADLHGLGEARAWALGAISDIRAWREGRIPWSQVSSGIALSGPPGCGKTTFAAVFCQEAGLHMVAATLAKWQSSGEAHLGHLLRAMRQDFEEARANAPSCIFIDEIDSFPERAGVTHAWRDYVIEVVNALLAEVDGIKGREGVIVIGASNDIGRCEPALLRAGRLETIVNIGRPDTKELERMLRVRLRNDLREEDLGAIGEALVGMVGADVERVVKDARRLARQDGGRPLAMDDLREALRPNRDLSNEERWRFCVHEAAHLVAEVIHFGPDGVSANAIHVGSRGGMTIRTKPAPFAGTLVDYRKNLEIRLAGRLGEELVLGAQSHGGGGASGSDLDNATSIAAAIVGSFGLVDDDHITYFGARDATEALLSFSEVRQAVARELAAASTSAKRLLEPNREAIEAIARRLLERGRVSGEEAAEVLLKIRGSILTEADEHWNSNASRI
jgi:AAA+ superfamily predicted ATPase